MAERKNLQDLVGISECAVDTIEAGNSKSRRQISRIHPSSSSTASPLRSLIENIPK